MSFTNTDIWENIQGTDVWEFFFCQTNFFLSDASDFWDFVVGPFAIRHFFLLLFWHESHFFGQKNLDFLSDCQTHRAGLQRILILYSLYSRYYYQTHRAGLQRICIPCALFPRTISEKCSLQWLYIYKFGKFSAPVHLLHKNHRA